MSLITTTDRLKLPFETDHPETYAMSGNRLFIVSEKWDYLMRDGLNQKTIYEGKFDEKEELSTINSIYSYWFYEVSYSRLFYYSPTDNNFKMYNMETKKVEKTYKNPFKIEREFEFFMFLEYREDLNKIFLVHMKEFQKCAIEECALSDNPEAKTIAEFELTNPNCIYYDRRILYFGSQTQETSPSKMHFLKDGVYFTVDFNYTENIQILDAGFYLQDLMYVLYNHNEKAESGAYLINKKLDPAISQSSIDAKEEIVQKIVLCGDEDPDILDGRIIVDRLLNSFTVTSMDKIRRFHVGQENGKYSCKSVSHKAIEQSIDYVPLNRESLTSWEFDEDKKEGVICFFRATDNRCLYHWLFQESGLSKEFNIGDLNELCELLI